MYFLKRLEETVIISMISSLPIYILFRLGLVLTTKIEAFIAFFISAFAFYILNGLCLKRHLAHTLNRKMYLYMNLMLFAVQLAICFLCIGFGNIGTYVAFFGYSKLFRVFLPDPFSDSMAYAFVSAGIFYFLYLGMILYFSLTAKEEVNTIIEEMEEFSVNDDIPEKNFKPKKKNIKRAYDEDFIAEAVRTAAVRGIKEASEELGVSRYSIEKWCEKNKEVFDTALKEAEAAAEEAAEENGYTQDAAEENGEGE